MTTKSQINAEANRTILFHRNWIDPLLNAPLYTILGLLILGVFAYAGAKILSIRLPQGQPREVPQLAYMPEVIIERPTPQPTAPSESGVVNAAFLTNPGTNINVAVPGPEYNGTDLPKVNSQGKFYWEQPPTNIRMLTYDELEPADKAWCDWMAQGVDYIDWNGLNQTVYIDNEMCAMVITVEAGGGILASLNLGITSTECQANHPCPATSSAGAQGSHQFMPGTWPSYIPWPGADIMDYRASGMGCSNMLKDPLVNIAPAFEKGIAQFVNEFACSPGYKNCQVWNAHPEHAKVVYTLAWKLQTYRNIMQGQ